MNKKKSIKLSIILIIVDIILGVMFTIDIIRKEDIILNTVLIVILAIAIMINIKTIRNNSRK
jgi:hypothetical protein